MRTISQGVSLLFTFGSSCSSHSLCGVYLPNRKFYKKHKKEKTPFETNSLSITKKDMYRKQATNCDSNPETKQFLNVILVHKGSRYNKDGKAQV